MVRNGNGTKWLWYEMAMVRNGYGTKMIFTKVRNGRYEMVMVRNDCNSSKSSTSVNRKALKLDDKVKVICMSTLGFNTTGYKSL
jgi:hypothetical protein